MPGRFQLASVIIHINHTARREQPQGHMAEREAEKGKRKDEELDALVEMIEGLKDTPNAILTWATGFTGHSQVTEDTLQELEQKFRPRGSEVVQIVREAK